VAPSLARRLACFVYEALILFGLLLLPAAAATVLLGSARPSLAAALAIQVATVLLFGAYFVGFWSGRGQTLPMQTWHIVLQTRAGTRVAPARAAARYLCAWIWVVPPVVAWRALGAHSLPALGLALCAWIGLYATAARFAPGRQFWHDVACGTRLVMAAPRVRGA
jgi:uncharacterized RDD family membrane protein YckC